MTETPKSGGGHPGPPGRLPRAPRFHTGLPASVGAAGSGGERRGCRLVNLSRSGALVARAPALPPGTRVDLDLRSATGNLTVGLGARVARSSADGDGQLGLRFVGVSPEQALALELLLSRIVEGSSSEPLREIEGERDPARIREALERMPLPHRVALARRATLAERSLLFRDRHPEVLTALARNPRVRVEEILALLARPTLVAPTLDAIAQDPRWASHEDLQVRLASHPGVTLQTANRVAATLTDRGRDRLLRQPGLQAALRRKLSGGR